MNLAIQVLGYGGIVPITIAVAAMYLCGRWLPPAASDRYAAAVACGIAFFVGYALLPSWAELWPTRHWQWLPYLAGAAMIIGPAALAKGVFAPERVLLLLMLALIAAWLLVPKWSRIEAQYVQNVVGVTAGFVLLSTLLDPLPKRMPPAFFVGILAVVTVCLSLALASSLSLKYGQVASIAAASLAGCSVGHVFLKNEIAARGLVPVFTLVVGGCAFVGFIGHDPPETLMLLLPLAPLALWATMWGPVSRLRGFAALTVKAAFVILPLTVAMSFLMLAERAGGDIYGS